MKFLLSVLVFFVFLCVIHAQNGQITGRVKLQSSNGKPLSNVEISSLSPSNNTYSATDGKFVINFLTKKSGDVVELDYYKENYLVVNEREVKKLVIPKDPAALNLVVVMANRKEYQERVKQYYSDITAIIQQNYEEQKQVLRNKMDNKDEGLQILIKQLDDLIKQRDQAIENAASLAEKLAAIDTDRASEMLKQALHKIEFEKDVNGALEILENSKLEEAYQTALKKKTDAENSIRQVLECYKLKIDILYSEFKIREMIDYYYKIIDIQKNNNYSEKEMAVTYNSLGVAFLIVGQFSNAIESLQKSVSMHEKVLDVNDPVLAFTYSNLGQAYTSVGDYQKALFYFQKAIAIKELIYGLKDSSLVNLYYSIGVLNMEIGDFEKALEHLTKAQIIFNELGASSQVIRGLVLNNICLIYKKLEEYHQALDYAIQAVSILEQIFENHPYLFESYNSIASIYQELGDTEQAIVYLLKAAVIMEKMQLPSLGIVYYNLGSNFQTAGDLQKAIYYLEKSLILLEKHNNLPYLANCYSNLGVLYAKTDLFEKSKAAFGKFAVLEPDDLNVYRNWAVYYALYNDKEQALQNLSKAIELGYNDIQWLSTDSSMDSIRNESEFKEIINKIKLD